MAKRTIKIRGKSVTFSTHVLKSGETAYYRSGKRVTKGYQKRVAKNVLNGMSLKDARGHSRDDFNQNFADKALSLAELQDTRLGARTEAGAQVDLGRWGATYESQDRGATSEYYADIYVTNESLRKAGSPTGDEEACKLVTLALVQRQGNNIKRKFSQADIARNFRNIILGTLEKYKLTLCTGSLEKDVVRFWRHATR